MDVDADSAFGTPVEIAEGVYQLRMPLPFRLDHINLYLLEDTSGWTLVDCGLNKSEVMALWDRLLGGFFTKKPLERIVVTHLHPDHVGLAAWLQERTGAPIYMTRGEWQLAQGVFNLPAKDPPAIEAHYQRLGLADAALRTTAQQASAYRRLVKTLPVTVRHLHEHESLTLGTRRWRILFGAGHSPCCACLWDETSGMLIAGDHVLPDITSNVNLLTIGPRNPLDDYLTSLHTFRELPCQLLLPAHGAPTSRYHARIGELIQHHQVRLERLREACQQPRTAADCVPLLFNPNLPDHQYFFAIGEAAAHLVYLHEHGQLRKEGESTWRFFQ
jgi:glyoxylase-like metal-dependent hydrolase (beta-lactamase superfamily II)